MSTAQQQNSSEQAVRQMLGCRTDNVTEADARPFSIRHFVSASRQMDIGHHWPFPDKYLKLCLTRGLTDILPPLDQHNSINDRNNSVQKETKGKQSNICTDFLGLERKSNNGQESSSTTAVEDATNLYTWLEGMISHLSWRVNHLSLSNDNQSPTRPPEIRPDPQELINNQRNYMENNMNMIRITGKIRKGKIKKKSLAEILAVAKHCVLDSFDTIYVAADNEYSFRTHGHDPQGGAVLGAHHKGNHQYSDSGLAEDLSKKKKKKNRRCEDNASADNPSKQKRSGAQTKYKKPEDMDRIPAKRMVLQQSWSCRVYHQAH